MPIFDQCSVVSVLSDPPTPTMNFTELEHLFMLVQFIVSSDSENRLAKTFSVVLYYRFLNDNIWSKIESYDRWTGARMSRAVRKFQYQSVWILPFPWKDRMASVGMYSTFSPGLKMIEHMRFKQASLNRIKKL